MAKDFSTILNNTCLLSGVDAPSSFSSTSEPYPEIKKYIQDTLESICSGFEWTFLESSYDLSTVSDQREYTLPAHLEPRNILQQGVRRSGWTPPLDYIQNDYLDRVVLTSGQPTKYSIFGQKLILDPTPDDVYTITIKYLTNYYAFSNGGTSQANLSLTNDYTVIPDRFVKTLEYGAAVQYRMQYFLDDKLAYLQNKYAEFLNDMKQSDGYGKDSSTKLVMGSYINGSNAVYNAFRCAGLQ